MITSELATGARFAEMLGLVPGGEGPGGRDDLPVHLPVAVRAARLQRRSASGQLPVRAGRPGHVPRLRAGQELHRRRARAARADDPGALHRGRHRQGSAARWRTPASSTRARRSPPSRWWSTCRCSTTRSRVPGRKTMTSEYASAVARTVRGLQEPAGRLRQDPALLRGRCSGSTWGCSPSSARCPRTADWRAISEEIWPFTLAPPSTALGEAEAGWRARGAAGAPAGAGTGTGTGKQQESLRRHG